MKAFMYILLSNDGSYYTGSTTDLMLRLQQHFAGEGANHAKKHPPVRLLYYEEYSRIDDVFYREKQIQGWSRKKKEALIIGCDEELKKAAECINDTHFKNNTEHLSGHWAESKCKRNWLRLRSATDSIVTAPLVPSPQLTERSRSANVTGFDPAQPPRALFTASYWSLCGAEVQYSIITYTP